MYVVKRPLRNFGKTLVVGTIIEDPASIKRFNTRFAEGKIIEVTEANYKANAAYFKEKYGVVLPVKAETVEAEPVEAKPKKVAEAPKVVTRAVSTK